jgi:hypothetical protein
LPPRSSFIVTNIRPYSSLLLLTNIIAIFSSWRRMVLSYLTLSLPPQQSHHSSDNIGSLMSLFRNTIPSIVSGTFMF